MNSDEKFPLNKLLNLGAGLLLVSVVRRGRGDRVVALAKKAGAGGSTAILGRGTAQNSILRMLCMADTQKEIVFTLASEKRMPAIISALKNAPDLCRKIPGIGFVVKVSDFLRPGAKCGEKETGNTSALQEEANMTEKRELICVIVNSGLADDVMFAAREAGASGGTIVRARGTATDEDCGFFGITIVPEKEMLLMLAEKQISEKILAAISATPCLSEPGCGIVFCVPVSDFFPLGRQDRAAAD